MAETFKSVMARNIGTSPVSLLTVGGSTTALGQSLTLANVSASQITVDVYIVRSGLNYYITKSAIIESGNSLLLGKDSQIVLQAADVLTVVSSAATSLDAVFSYLELT